MGASLGKLVVVMTPLERAARAYHDSTRQFRYVRDCLKPSAPPIARPVPFVEWDDLDEEARAERKKQVRAVLAAIREPSDGPYHLVRHIDDWTIQDRAGGAGMPFARSYADSSVGVGQQIVRAMNVQAMIDAALSEKPE